MRAKNGIYTKGLVSDRYSEIRVHPGSPGYTSPGQGIGDGWGCSHYSPAWSLRNSWITLSLNILHCGSFSTSLPVLIRNVKVKIHMLRTMVEKIQENGSFRNELASASWKQKLRKDKKLIQDLSLTPRYS